MSKDQRVLSSSMLSKTTLILVPLVLLAFLILTWYFSSASEELILGVNRKSLERDARSIIHIVENEYKNRYSDVVLLAKNPIVINTLKSKAEFSASKLLSSLKKNYRIYSALELYNPEGSLIASSSPAMMDDLKSQGKDNQSSQTWFQKALSGEKGYTPVSFSERYRSLVVSFYSDVIDSTSGKRIGAVRAVFAWKHIVELIHLYEDERKVDKYFSRTFFLIDNNNRLVYHPKTDQILKPSLELFGKQNPTSLKNFIFEGKNYLTASIQVNSHQKNTLFGWSCLGAQSITSALGSVRETQQTLIAGSALVSFCLIALIFFAINLVHKNESKMQKRILSNSKLASIGELAAGVGHEVNNPLAVIMGQVIRIQKQLESVHFNKDQVGRALAKIELSGNRIRQIVDGLRTYARKDSTDLDVISMREVIDQTVSLLGDLLESEKVEFFKKTPEKELYTYGSFGKLQQVVMNLISNAKDSTEGQEKRLITLSLESPTQDMLVFMVKDNGTGMSPETQKKIFEPFFTTKGIGKGTGMGLGICQKIVTDMGGKISIRSTLGQGTEFYITIPRVEHIQQDASKDSMAKAFHEPTSIDPSNSLNVLVVDDSDDIREILRFYLEELGCHVEEANCGEAALEKLTKDQNEYNFVFTDMKMPGMGGEELLREIRKFNLAYPLKLIAVTGGTTTSFEKGKTDSLTSLVDGYILKPLDMADIKEVLTLNSENKKLKEAS